MRRLGEKFPELVVRLQTCSVEETGALRGRYHYIADDEG